MLKCPSFFFPVSPLPSPHHSTPRLRNGRRWKARGKVASLFLAVFFPPPPPFSETDTRSLVLLRLRRRSSLCPRPLGRCTRAIIRQEEKEKQVADKKGGTKNERGKRSFFFPEGASRPSSCRHPFLPAAVADRSSTDPSLCCCCCCC